MKDVREPDIGKYKQVYYKDAKGPKYTSCKMPEDDYLQTTVWKELKKEVLERDHYKCVACGSDNLEDLQIHHKKYPDVWGEEELDDLVTLCKGCHKAIHTHLLGGKK